MKTGKIFVHISDLHVAAKNRPGGVDNSVRMEKTWLIAQPDNENHCFVEEFCKYVRSNYSEQELYLIVSGDIADSSEEEEYRYAKLFLQKIMNDLSIEKSHVLLVPGNHDVNRYECEQAARNDSTKDACAFNAEKYKYFSAFYEDLLEKKFPVDNAIVDYMTIDDEKLLFVGINSNHKTGYIDGSGAVDIERFKKEMRKLCQYHEDYTIIAVFHHNIVTSFDKSISHYGSWLKDDWLSFKSELEYFKVKCVLYGNEHTRSSSSMEGNMMYYSDCGSIALKDPRPTFKLYIHHKDVNKTVLKQKVVELNNANRKGERSFGVWVEQNIHDLSELDEIVLCEKANSSSPTSDFLPSSANDKEFDKSQPHQVISQPSSINVPFQESLLDIIKRDNLFHQGHFHWGKSSRSLNWIDTITLLSNREYFKFIRDELIRFVEVNEIQYDFVLGIGMEGNILSTPLYSSDCPYTYLPYSYRYKEANECEKNICVSNDGKYKKVLVVTDVVHQGRMLRALFEEKEKDFFAGVEQINILSLFYTGKEDDNTDGLPEGLAEMKEKVNFYALMELKVGKCPYNNDYAKRCANYNHRLCEVYKFYNE